MWYVYILECSDSTFYTWITTDTSKRLRQHNWEIVWWAKYTKVRQPVKMIYQENSEDRSSASKRECEIKKLTRKQKEELIQSSK